MAEHALLRWYIRWTTPSGVGGFIAAAYETRSEAIKWRDRLRRENRIYNGQPVQHVVYAQRPA